MKQIINYIKNNYKILLVVIGGALIGGYIVGKSTNQQINTSTHQQINESTHQLNNEAAPHEIWTCSMHPQIKQDHPGNCPICGMKLIPLTTTDSESEDADPNEITLSNSAAKLADIETVIVKEGVPEKTVFLQGKIRADERNIAELTARFGGRIEKLFVNFTGQEVKKGEKLATIYSPGLVTAQRELLESVDFKESRPALYTSARAKLKLWDLTDKQISAIEEKGEPQIYFNVLSPITGTVTKRYIALGDYIKEGMSLFRVINLTKVWGMFDAYESDLPWVKLGDKVEFTVEAIPGKNYSAKITFIDPVINDKTRIAKVRVEIPNKNKELKPGMFLNGIVMSKNAGNTKEILVPKSSILWTGKRAVVYVKVPNRKSPSFLYREVVLGPSAGAFYVIKKGLKAGEEIATNGVFKIDAAAQLQGLPSMMNPEGGAGSTPHDMSKMDMGGSKKKTSKTKKTKPTSNKERKAKVNTEFQNQLSAVYDDYLKLKNAFVASNEAEINKDADITLKSVKNVDMKLVEGSAHLTWMSIEEVIVNNLNGIIQMKGIEMKRKHFSIISNKIYELLEQFGKTNGTPLYYQYCPMAFNNEGAYWISGSKKIINPYFTDDSMRVCGETKKTIN